MATEPNRLSAVATKSVEDQRESLFRSQADLIAWRQKLQSALINSITEDDMKSIVEKQMEKAKNGDEKAAKFIVSLVLSAGPGVSLRQTNVITDPKTAALIAKGKS